MAKQKILVVDDEQDLRTIIANELTIAGYEVYQANDGEEGLALALKLNPDLVVCDVLLPKKDGNQFLKELRATSLGKDIPFIVITARTGMKDYFESIKVEAFLEKPFETDVLLSEIAGIFKKKDTGTSFGLSKRVLVAGSNVSIIDSMIGQLQGAGCHTDLVTSGHQVVSKAVMFLPNIIILDVEIMEGMQSYEIIKVLKQMPQFRKTPILIYNYYDAKDKSEDEIKQRDINIAVSVTRCMELEANENIGKFEQERFITIMNKYLKKGTIVVVDDDKNITKLLKITLEKEEYNVHAARDGKEGIDIIKDVKPDLVLLDIVMPEMTGYQVMKFLKKDPSVSDIPIIMVTVKDQEQDIDTGVVLGAYDYVTKPFNMKLLIKKIQNILDNK